MRKIRPLVKTRYGYRTNSNKPDMAELAVTHSIVNAEEDFPRPGQSIRDRNSWLEKIAINIFTAKEFVNEFKRASRVLVKNARKKIGPRTPLEREIEKIWIDVTGFEEWSVHDDLFDVIADSLIAVRILSRVCQTNDVIIPITVLFTGAFTISQLALYIELKRIEQYPTETIRESLDLISKLSDEEVRSALNALEGRN